MTSISKAGKRLGATVALVALLVATGAQAGPFAEFESDLRGVYAVYRSALFATNQNKPDESAKTVAALSQGWSKLEAKWAKAAPPQYADDAKFAPILSAAAGEIATANKQIADGQLGAAHLTLEKIRDQLGELRARNNISTTSDRMNEFHEEMEKTLEHAKSDITPAVLGDLRGEGAVLAYLIDRIAAAPPPEARNSEEFGQLVLATKAAVKAVREAAASGDAAAAKRALQGLKKPYAILFLKFG
ncbi:MAG: hypothetical protein KDJ44_05850 [Rhodoblastus sp.]|nr:hypothetical protein [Rhodoblastus sp.]